MGERFTYWCRYEVDPTIPAKHMATRWPPDMKGWVSGYAYPNDDDNAAPVVIWCARVDAATAEEAERIIRGCYGPSGDQIRLSWSPQQNPLGWRPTGGRFPE